MLCFTDSVVCNISIFLIWQLENCATRIKWCVKFDVILWVLTACVMVAEDNRSFLFLLPAGLKWIKQAHGESLVTVRLGQKNYLDVIERAVSSGETVLLENLEESIDPVLDPLLGRNTIKRGRAIKLGDKEIDYSPQFRLILHTKLGNPHYKPETQAQTTLINFTVTRDGLEDQLLAAVVGKERKDLEETKAALTKQQNEFKINLKELEDNLLARLSSAEGNFLGKMNLLIYRYVYM